MTVDWFALFLESCVLQSGFCTNSSASSCVETHRTRSNRKTAPIALTRFSWELNIYKVAASCLNRRFSIYISPQAAGLDDHRRWPAFTHFILQKLIKTNINRTLCCPPHWTYTVRLPKTNCIINSEIYSLNSPIHQFWKICSTPENTFGATTTATAAKTSL